MIGYIAQKQPKPPKSFISSVWSFPRLSHESLYKDANGATVDQLNCVIPKFFWYDLSNVN